MKRWQKIFIVMFSIALVLGIGGLITANYLIDKMLASFSNSLIADMERTVLTEAETPRQQGTAEPDKQADGEEKEGTAPAQQEEEQQQPVKADTPATASAEQGHAADNDDKNETDQAAPAGAGSGKKYNPEVSVDKAKDIQETATVAEKAKVTSILLGKLSLDDIKTLQQLASGGLSVEKKKEARTLLLEKLSEDEYNELIAIAKKYGVSQGRSYDEVKDE